MAVAEGDDAAGVGGDVGLVRDQHHGDALLAVEPLHDGHDLVAGLRRRSLCPARRGVPHRERKLSLDLRSGRAPMRPAHELPDHDRAAALGERLHVAVTLRTREGTDEASTFSASLAGDRIAGTGLAVAIRTAPAGIRGALLIRMHGVWLWARRLRVQPRPHHHQPGVS